ncbi:MAG: isoprenylcysteine carboxylmethyltransferase family protein [Deltaproteobacteria bacterium]|nr:isoprenylcysteine carboxylmethyltransferase family protein [Candidatus Zymogenaceae bacterium]
MRNLEKFEGDFLYAWYKLRGVLMTLPYVFAFFCIWNEHEHYSVFIFGLALVIAAFLLRLWAQLHLHYRLKVTKILTMTGPYTYVRNPIYISNIMLLAGYVLMSELVWLVPVSIFYGYIVYHIVVAYEEHHLQEKYGEPYTEYLERVPRWFPKISFHLKGEKPDGEWSRVRSFLLPSLRAEYQCLLIALIPLAKELLDYYSFIR